MEKAVIFNIQRYTIHDGPGLRTELFLKGCPLRCAWCSNPESWRLTPEPGVYKSRCIGFRQCGLCAAGCSQQALGFYRNKLVAIDREKCIRCLQCADACPAEAVKQWGKTMTVAECMEVIRRDKGYYERSGGGVTVSGGEPLLQADFVAELFAACKAEGISTCCESTFHADWETIQKVLPVSDILISDIKHMDSAVHKQYTGQGNERILENLERLSSVHPEIILRIPVIPGVNDDPINIEATADFILNRMGGRIRTLQLLSYMRLGEEKYQSLGIPYPMNGLRLNRKVFQKKVEGIADYFNGRGIHCLVGTKEKE